MIPEGLRGGINRRLPQRGDELLMRGREADGRAFRLIGAGLSDLVETSAEATDLFDSDERRARVKETALDNIRARYGAAAVVTGRNLKSRA